MGKIVERQLNNKTEAMAFCNDLIGHFMKPAFEPIIVKYGFRKQRSLNQNAWYFKWLTDYVVMAFNQDPVKLVNFLVTKVIKFKMTTESVHELLKIVYNDGLTTTRNDTKKMMEYCDKIRHDFLHDYEIHIPEPTIQGYEDMREIPANLKH